MATNLSELIIGLKAFTVILVENDFTYEQDPEKVLGKLCCTDSSDRDHILKGLSKTGLHDLTEKLNETTILFNDIQHDDPAFDGMPARDHIVRYLNKIGKKEILENEVLSELKVVFKKDNDNSFKNILLRHGIYGTTTDQHYQELISELNAIKGMQILYYNSRPLEKEMIELEKILLTKKKETGNKFSLAIVDNKLGAGTVDEEGKQFIIDDLLELNLSKNLKIICCIYTNHYFDNEPAVSYKDYFIQKIKKGNVNISKNLAECLAQAAYAEVFNSIKGNTIKSADDAFKMVLKNQKNIKHIVCESHNEGISSYEAIKHWYSMALNKQFEEKELKEFLYYGNLTSFFNNIYLNDHPSFSQISEELKALSSYEFFDYTINKKHLPIAPGDIWKAGDDYFILIGQLCDLLIRKTNKRNAKIGELIKIKVSSGRNADEKFEINIKNRKKQIHIDYFHEHDSGEYKKIIADVSTPNLYFADLSVLDLSIFNRTGDCKIDLNTSLDESIKSVLPENNDEYFISLKEFYESFTKFLKQLYYPSDTAQIKQFFSSSAEKEYSIQFSKMNFDDQDGVIDHGIKRVARLKDKYYDSLYKSYLNNKGRIDLNLIDNSPEISINVKLKCSFFNDTESLQEVEEINLWESRKEVFFKKEELFQKSDPKFHAVLDYFDDKIILGSDTKGIIKGEDESFEIIFYYRLDGENQYIHKSNFKCGDLIRGKAFKKYKELGIKVRGNGEERLFNSEKISLEELKSGIEISDESELVKLKNGIIKRTTY